jgi:hypothetical protein
VKLTIIAGLVMGVLVGCGGADVVPGPGERDVNAMSPWCAQCYSRGQECCGQATTQDEIDACLEVMYECAQNNFCY